MRQTRIVRQSWPDQRNVARDRSYAVLRFDGHTHTAYSRDAVHPVADFMWLAEAVDLDMVVLTDHGATSARQDLARRYRGPVVSLIGAEVGGPFGHAVVWGLPSGFDFGASRAASDSGQEVGMASMQALAERAHASGALVVLAHPGWWIGGNEFSPRRWMQYDSLRRGGIGEGIDALELWSQVYWHRARMLVDEWAAILERGLYVPIVGNSDFHNAGVHRLGTPRNACLCPLTQVSTASTTSTARPEPASLAPTEVQDCWLSAVREGRLYITDGPTIDLQVAGHVPGEVVEAVPHSRLTLRVRAEASDGGELRVFMGQARVLTRPLRPGEALEETLSLPVSAEDTFVRAEIERVGPAHDPLPLGAPPFSLLTNPVRIDVLPLRNDGWRGVAQGQVPPPVGFSRREYLHEHQREMRALRRAHEESR